MICHLASRTPDTRAPLATFEISSASHLQLINPLNVIPSPVQVR